MAKADSRGNRFNAEARRTRRKRGDLQAALAPGARPYITRMLRVVPRLAEPAPLSGVTPIAAAAAETLDAFFEEVEQRGRDLARSGTRLEDVTSALRDFDAQVGAALDGRFQPAREQLQLATCFALNRAFYESRDEDVRRLESLARQAEEQERRRIGRELHDEAGQSLLLLRLQLEMLERRAPSRLRLELVEARATVERIVTELRRIVAALSPSILERMGLIRATRQLAARFEKTCGIRTVVRVRETVPLPVQIQEVVYRVAQEALQNAAKHSRANAVNLSLEITDKSVRLRVTDNGAGFLVDTASSRSGSFGLAGMRERAALWGGTLTVRSSPGKGSVIALRLPVSTMVIADAQNSSASD